jgi:hypothetical protein
MRKLVRIDSSYPLEELIEFCKNAESDTRPGAKNMDYVDWENKPHTFLYLLYKEKRFDGEYGGYIICKENEQIICGHGFYLSEIDKVICCGSRGYSLLGKNCANVHGDIKDMIYAYAKTSGAIGCFYSFNEYNKRYVDGYIKVNDPSNYISSYVDDDGQWWSKNGRKIHPHQSYGPIRLKDTKQWIVYYLFNPSNQTYMLEQLKTIDWHE